MCAETPPATPREAAWDFQLPEAFGISIDGDLYKAQLTFDRLPNLPEDIQTEEAEPEEPKENEQTAPEVQPASEASAQNPVENKENLQAPAQIQPEIQHEESPQAENR